MQESEHLKNFWRALLNGCGFIQLFGYEYCQDVNDYFNQSEERIKLNDLK
jgi:hypothetical protein